MNLKALTTIDSHPGRNLRVVLDWWLWNFLDHQLHNRKYTKVALTPNRNPPVNTPKSNHQKRSVSESGPNSMNCVLMRHSLPLAIHKERQE